MSLRWSSSTNGITEGSLELSKITSWAVIMALICSKFITIALSLVPVQSKGRRARGQGSEGHGQEGPSVAWWRTFRPPRPELALLSPAGAMAGLRFLSYGDGSSSKLPLRWFLWERFIVSEWERHWVPLWERFTVNGWESWVRLGSREMVSGVKMEIMGNWEERKREKREWEKRNGFLFVFTFSIKRVWQKKAKN